MNNKQKKSKEKCDNDECKYDAGLVKKLAKRIQIIKTISAFI